MKLAYKYFIYSNPNDGVVDMCLADSIHEYLDKGTVIEDVVYGTFEVAELQLKKIQNTYFRVCDDYHPDVGF